MALWVLSNSLNGKVSLGKSVPSILYFFFFGLGYALMNYENQLTLHKWNSDSMQFDLIQVSLD